MQTPTALTLRALTLAVCACGAFACVDDPAAPSDANVQLEYTLYGGYNACSFGCPEPPGMCDFIGSASTVGIFEVVEFVPEDTTDACFNPFEDVSTVSRHILRPLHHVWGDAYRQQLTVVDFYGFNMGAAREGHQIIVALYDDGSDAVVLNVVQAQTSTEPLASPAPDTPFNLPTSLAELRRRAAQLQETTCDPPDSATAADRFRALKRPECR